MTRAKQLPGMQPRHLTEDEIFEVCSLHVGPLSAAAAAAAPPAAWVPAAATWLSAAPVCARVLPQVGLQPAVGPSAPEPQRRGLGHAKQP